MKGIAKENPFFTAGKELKIKPYKAGEVKTTARSLYNKIDVTFQKVCSVSFGEALNNLPELQLKKENPQLKSREKREPHIEDINREKRTNERKLPFCGSYFFEEGY